ncbi:putative hydrolase of the HAD superfamily [Methanomicrobium sp. W14]|uniref:HAD family hydrolase n=1 Tax=Methanomicrobium sp. W14 TaxID=2817839 RepID=UPI001AEAC6EF|nr:HAD family hydrolase [Methanomicrobium sp. W14]MBP2132646.1 putative hydrolase of the HAD superfamily [Methanomicrobium sp. W14]
MNQKDTVVRRPDVILFDMDNTLYDFSDAKLKACTAVVDYIGAGTGEELLRYFLYSGFGFEDHRNISQFMTDKNITGEETFKKAAGIYESVKLESIVAYPGVYETLPLISDAGIKMSIVTDAESSQAEKRVEKIGIRRYFRDIISPDKSGRRKPEPNTFIMALDRLSTDPSDSMVVGDSPRREIEPCNKLGMTTVYAKYGDWLKIPSPQVIPDYTIEKFSEIAKILNL